MSFASGCASGHPADPRAPATQQIEVGRACPKLAKLVEKDVGQDNFFEVAALDEPSPSPLSTWPRGKGIRSRQVAGLLVRDGAVAEAPWRMSASQSAQDDVSRIRVAPQKGDEVLIAVRTPRSEVHSAIVLASDQQPVLAKVGAEQVVVTRYRLSGDLHVALSTLAKCRDMDGPPRDG